MLVSLRVGELAVALGGMPRALRSRADILESLVGVKPLSDKLDEAATLAGMPYLRVRVYFFKGLPNSHKSDLMTS